jgi:UDP-N-acetyl-D-mannosaminuronic acid dehydrogenase
MKSLCVIGLGYIGLPTASLFANQGFRVKGVDAKEHVVEMVNSGRNHIQEVGLRTMVEAAISSGQLSASLEPSCSDAFIIAVPTPFGPNKEPDLTHVFDAARKIIPVLEPGNLVVVESTVPPGTTEKVAALIAERRPDLVGDPSDPVGSLQVHLAHCPERVLPGRILKELVENDRVIGGLNPRATECAIDLYKRIVSGTIFGTDATTAEMVKLSENTFRDVNISLVNELAIICEKLGISVWEVIELANKHPRVKMLTPGPGVGGHCIAVDPWFIVSEFPEDANLIRAARLRNDAMPDAVVARVERLVQGVASPVIACLGASYKGNVGDARNSPAIEIYEKLRAKFDGKGEVRINDMYVDDKDLPLVSLREVIEKADLVLVLVDHFEYRALDPVEIAKKVGRRVVYDTRNTLNHDRWRAAGFEVHILGSGTHGTAHPA